MTTLTDLVNDIIAVTNRPDLETRIILAVQKVTLKEHAAIKYARDLIISPAITLVSSSDFRYQIDRTVVPLVRLRAIKTIREVTSSQPSLQTFSGFYNQLEFKEAALDNIFDEYNTEKRDYFYRQGNFINLVATRDISQVQVSYYQSPDVSIATYQSWIANEYSYLIYDAAAAEIFGSIGNNQEHASYLNKANNDRLDVIKAEVNEFN